MSTQLRSVQLRRSVRTFTYRSLFSSISVTSTQLRMLVANLLDEYATLSADHSLHSSDTSQRRSDLSFWRHTFLGDVTSSTRVGWRRVRNDDGWRHGDAGGLQAGFSQAAVIQPVDGEDKEKVGDWRRYSGGKKVVWKDLVLLRKDERSIRNPTQNILVERLAQNREKGHYFRLIPTASRFGSHSQKIIITLW